jgi:predicted Fe-Mo cluster-binding NifX family protein
MKKIAVATPDGKKIDNHFGMAKYYSIFDVDAIKITPVGLREKPHKESHQHDANHEHGQQGHGLGTRAIQAIDDCQVLICGGMGQPAFLKAQDAGLEVFLAGGNVEEAVQAYQKGELKSDQRRIHTH